MLNLIPWPYRLLAIAALAIALLGFGWVKGASHVQDEWNAEQQAQTIKIVRIQTQQKAQTQEINHEASNLIDRSDAYYRGLRLSAHPVPTLPGSAGAPDAASSSGETDPAGDTPRAGCDPADGSADAIQVIELLRWARAMKAAERGL